MFKKIVYFLLISLLLFAVACGDDSNVTAQGNKNDSPDAGNKDAGNKDTDDKQDAAPPACQADETLCGGTCVDLLSDPDHCGACDAACAPQANADATCSVGSCDYSCKSGFTDADSDLGIEGGNGCETEACEPTRGGVEICDGLDNDCDGLVDNGFDDLGDTCTVGDGACEVSGTKICSADGSSVTCSVTEQDAPDVTIDCPLQDGVCAGAQIRLACPIAATPTCTENEYGPDYTSAGDEDWTCDGLDNNCDGTVDEACCGFAGNDAEPTSVSHGSGYDADGLTVNIDKPRPTIVTAISGSPANAAALVVWVKDAKTVVAQHVDKYGTAVGTPFTQRSSSGYNMRAVTVVAAANTYEVIWAEATEPNNDNDVTRTIKVQPLRPTLAKQGGDVTLLSETKTLLTTNLLTAAYHDRAVLVGELAHTLGSVVHAYTYRIDDRNNSQKTLSLGSGGFFGTISLRTAALDSGLLITWYSTGGFSDPSSLNGKLYDANGTAQGSFLLDSDWRQSNGQYDILQTGDKEVMIVYPRSRGSNRALVATTVNLTSGAELNTVDLTNATASNSAPALLPQDLDGDGYADQTTVLWTIRSSSSTTLVASSFDAQNPGLMTTSSKIRGNVPNLDNSDIAASGPGAIATWQTRGSTQRVYTAPLSFQGPGICD